MYRRLADSSARQKVLLADACRDAPRPGSERAVSKSTDTVEGFAGSLSRPPEGILVLTSCKPGQMSIEDDKLGHSVFMHFILKGFRGEADRDGGNGNARVSLFELYRYADLKTRTHVARTWDLVQTPLLRGRVAGDAVVLLGSTAISSYFAVLASEQAEAGRQQKTLAQAKGSGGRGGSREKSPFPLCRRNARGRSGTGGYFLYKKHASIRGLGQRGRWLRTKWP